MILVIGYGNDLRGDDAVGLRVVEQIRRSHVPSVRALTVPQLTPELAEPLSQANAAVFVDAAVHGPPGRVDVTPCGPVDLFQPIGHLSDPRSLLALTEAVFERSPAAWLVTVQVESLELREGLSPAASQACRAAVEAVEQLLARLSIEQPPEHHHHPH